MTHDYHKAADTYLDTIIIFNNSFYGINEQRILISKALMNNLLSI